MTPFYICTTQNTFPGSFFGPFWCSARDKGLPSIDIETSCMVLISSQPFLFFTCRLDQQNHTFNSHLGIKLKDRY